MNVILQYYKSLYKIITILHWNILINCIKYFLIQWNIKIIYFKCFKYFNKILLKYFIYFIEIFYNLSQFSSNLLKSWAYFVQHFWNILSKIFNISIKYCFSIDATIAHRAFFSYPNATLHSTQELEQDSSPTMYDLNVLFRRGLLQQPLHDPCQDAMLLYIYMKIWMAHNEFSICTWYWLTLCHTPLLMNNPHMRVAPVTYSTCFFFTSMLTCAMSSHFKQYWDMLIYLLSGCIWLP